MPQKKNFPILERIRGRTAHVAAVYVDLLLSQRSVPFTNMIEVSKEVGSGAHAIFDDLDSALRLFHAVLEKVQFRGDRMRQACERDFLGGFTLANLLTLRAAVPWRTAQVVVGEYISAALAKGYDASRPMPTLLHEAMARHGYPIDDTEALLAEAFDVDRGLRSKRTVGSAHPDSVRALLTDERTELERLSDALLQRRATVRLAVRETDHLLGLTD
jgi:argininosuccinate lyase